MSRSLPIFPLPLVLFPGAVQPLHIFEPRYRRMLVDCLASDAEFGVLCRLRDVPETAIQPGTIGCVAHIESTQELPDGRSNIMVMGTERFVFQGFLESETPYHVALVEPLSEPASSPDLLAALSERVRTTFRRVGEAARSMQDDPSPLPELPSDPGLLSFAIAQYVDLDLPDKQRILSAIAPDERLRQLDQLLSPLVGEIEQRAMVHGHAKSNGQGHGQVAPGS